MRFLVLLLAVLLALLQETQAKKKDDYYVYMNTYSGDNFYNDDCRINQEWSTLTISRMPAGCSCVHAHGYVEEDFCRQFEHGKPNQTQFPPVEFLGLFCDASQCNGCASNIDNLEYGVCKTKEDMASIGSIALYPEPYYCLGSPELSGKLGGYALFFYSNKSCTMRNKDDAKNILQIRKYNELASTCTQDGTQELYYAINRSTDKNDNVLYNGVVHCTDAKCTQNCIEIKDLEEFQCSIIKDDKNFGAVQIARAEDILSQCEHVPQPGESTPAPPPGPGNNLLDDKPGLVAGIIAGGVGIAAILFGLAFCYRKNNSPQQSSYGGRNEGGVSGGRRRYQQQSHNNSAYQRIPATPPSQQQQQQGGGMGMSNNPGYGAITDDDEGMTTDI